MNEFQFSQNQNNPNLLKEQIEKQLSPLNDPESRKTIEDYAKTFVSVVEPAFSFYQGEKAPKGTYEASFANAMHFAVDNKTRDDENDLEREYLHRIVDTILKMPRGGMRFADTDEEKEKARELTERQNQLAGEYIRNKYDVPGFLKTTFDLLGKEYKEEPQDTPEMFSLKNNLDQFENSIDFFEWAMTDPEFAQKLEASIEMPFSPSFNGNFANDIMNVVLADGQDTPEKTQRISEYSNRINNDFLKLNRIGAENFKLLDFLKKELDENPELKAEIIEQGKKYGAEWKF